MEDQASQQEVQEISRKQALEEDEALIEIELQVENKQVGNNQVSKVPELHKVMQGVQQDQVPSEPPAQFQVMQQLQQQLHSQQSLQNQQQVQDIQEPEQQPEQQELQKQHQEQPLQSQQSLKPQQSLQMQQPVQEQQPLQIQPEQSLQNQQPVQDVQEQEQEQPLHEQLDETEKALIEKSKTIQALTLLNPMTNVTQIMSLGAEIEVLLKKKADIQS